MNKETSSTTRKRPATWEELIEEKMKEIDILLRSAIIDAANLGNAPLMHCLSESYLRLYDAKREMSWGETGESESVAASIKSDWKMPDPPDVACPFCGELCHTPVAFLESTEWSFFWDCSEMHGEVPNTTDLWVGVWPFEEEHATPEDMEAAGFTCWN